MEYTILILILPFLSFLILGLAGMRMKNSVAGAIGTAGLIGLELVTQIGAEALVGDRIFEDIRCYY